MKRQSQAEVALNKQVATINANMTEIQTARAQLQAKWDTLFDLKQQTESEIHRLYLARESKRPRS
jgi:prefoldin subunit 5